MSKYIKNLDDTQKNYNKGLKKSFSLYGGVPEDENLLKLDKYVFKNGDLMCEIITEDFPFKLKKDTCFSMVSVKGETSNIIVELEAKQVYFCKYITKDFGFSFIVSYNEEKKEVITNAIISDELIKAFDSKKIRKEQIVDMAVDSLSKMISISTNDKYCLKHETASDIKIMTKNSMKNIGKPILVTTRHKNTIVICDAYPLFYEIDFKQLAIDSEV